MVPRSMKIHVSYASVSQGAPEYLLLPTIPILRYSQASLTQDVLTKIHNTDSQRKLFSEITLREHTT